MAELVRDGDAVVLRLTTAEKVEGLHGDIRVAAASVESVTVVDDVIHAVHGLKMPGSRIPGVFAMGTFISGNKKVFAIVHHKTKRGVRVSLRDSDFDALIVGADDPEALVSALGLA